MAPPAAPAEPPPADRQDKLRDIQSITDAALSALTPQALLEALTERARQALGADTAAMLMLDGPAGQLIATAASGLEEEVEQGVRVPLGQGFAGRVAERGEVVILSGVDRTNVINPLLVARGIHTLMGAPLRADGEVIGVLHVGTLTPREFTRDDADLLQLAADRAAVAVQALSAQVDRAAAVALQRSLLPAALPVIPGLQLAARYVPGAGVVGGDWYDVFTLPSGHVCAVIGDVAGSGIWAGVIMGRLRAALRAYALETTDPAEILERLDRKIQHFEPDALATVLCAVLRPGLDEAVVSCAGHLPPVLLRPGQPAVLADVAPDILIGAGRSPARRAAAIGLPAGTVLCLYTDGLVERRGELLDTGLDALATALTAAAGSGPEACCAALMAAMAPHSSRADDTALLILRRDDAAPGEREARDRGRER